MPQPPSLPMSQLPHQHSRGENALHPAQLGLYRDCGPPPHVVGCLPLGEVASLNTGALLSRSKMSIETQNPPQQMTFFDIDGTSMSPPDPNNLAYFPPMAGSTNSEHYDPHLFGVEPRVEYSDPRADRGDGHGDTNMFDFYPGGPWSHWPAVERPMDEAAGHMYHPGPPFPLGPTAPGMTDFEPMLTTIDSHGMFSTQAGPKSPSPSSTATTTRSPYSDSVAAFSRKNSFQLAVHSPAASIVQPTQLEFRFEPVSPGAWRSSPTTPLPAAVARRRYPGDAEHYFAAADAMSVTTAAAGEAPDDSPEYVTVSPTADDDRSPTSDAGPSKKKPTRPRGGEPAGEPNHHRHHHPPPQPPPPQPPSSSSTSGSATMSQRQRNRAAATKCRKKSKVAIAQLEATDRALSEQHSELSATVTGLRDEVLALKNEILLHGNCDCEIIQSYLTNAARNLKGTMAAAGQGSAAAGQQQQQQQQQRAGRSVGSSSSSVASPTPPAGPLVASTGEHVPCHGPVFCR